MTKSLKILAIVVFVIVDIAAAIFAIRHVNQRPASDGSSLAVPSEKTSATPTTPEPKGEEAQEPSGLVVTGSTVAQFIAGACDAPGVARLDVSADQAKTFEEVALPLGEDANATGNRQDAITTILSVTLKSAAELTLIGRDADCDDVRYTTENAGQDWTKADSVEDWYVAGDRAVTPIGASDAGCEVLSVWPISERNARVGCTDGQIRGTDDAGEEWVGLGALDDLSAVTFSTIRDGFGAADEDDCASRVYSTGSAGGEWDELGCINEKQPATAIGGSNAFLAALVAGEVVVSTDQGETWKKP